MTNAALETKQFLAAVQQNYPINFFIYSKGFKDRNIQSLSFFGNPEYNMYPLNVLRISED